MCQFSCRDPVRSVGGRLSVRPLLPRLLPTARVLRRPERESQVCSCVVSHCGLFLCLISFILKVFFSHFTLPAILLFPPCFGSPVTCSSAPCSVLAASPGNRVLLFVLKLETNDITQTMKPCRPIRSLHWDENCACM